MYKIRGADQKEYGPVSAEQLRQWIAQKRANAQTLVQAEGGTDWKPLGEIAEFRDALATGPRPSGPLPPLPPPLGKAASPRNGLAVTSLVLGILGMLCLGFLAGIPAIITGHVAHGRARRHPERYAGTGFAIAGFVLGYLSILTTLVLLGLMLPALAKARYGGQSVLCENQMKQIILAARMYSNDHGDMFPGDFLQMTNELASPSLLICPSDRPGRREVPQTWQDLDRGDITYEFALPGLKERDAAGQVIFRCPIHGNVCYGDGSVQRGTGRRSRR